MERNKIETKVNDILVDILGIGYDEIKDDAVLEADFGADSIDAVEIVMELEHEFGITITDEKMYELSMAKVSDVYDLVGELL